MNGTEILRYILSDSIISNYFGGIFAVDQMIFPLPKKDIYFVCNTDNFKNKGKHWIVIFVKQNSTYIEYFDSLGKKPSKDFINFMSQSGKNILYSKKKIQSNTSYACGYFCLYYIYLRCRYIDFYTIIDIFTSNMSNNEKKVKNFIKHLFHH